MIQGTLTIGIVGDVMLGRTLNNVISKKGYDYPWGNVLSLMKETDLNLINLETCLTNSEQKVYKTFNFKASPEKVFALLNAQITIANLANNHILDFDKEGLLETIATLDKAGIKHVGAGKNLEKATAPVVIHQKGIRLGFLGLTDNEPEWKANGGPGTNHVDLNVQKEKDNVLHAIEKLRKEVDLIVVSIHWGPNMKEKPSSTFVNFAHAMIDSGANVIHGHSAHILQGIECYKKNLILYDTGDFVDDYVVDPELRNDLSAFFVVKISQSGLLHLQMTPVRMAQYQVNLAENEDKKWVILRMQNLSADFGTVIDKRGNMVINPE